MFRHVLTLQCGAHSTMRSLRKVKLSRLMIIPDGTLQQPELAGLD